MKEQGESKRGKGLDGIGPKTNPLPRIPEGEYEAVCTEAKVSLYLGKELRLYLHFKIIAGEHEGKKIRGNYNFDYKVFPTASKYYTDWSIANGALPRRRDRMTPRIFIGKAFLVKVRDAIPRYEDRTPKPEMFRYSVVDRIIERLTG